MFTGQPDVGRVSTGARSGTPSLVRGNTCSVERRQLEPGTARPAGCTSSKPSSPAATVARHCRTIMRTTWCVWNWRSTAEQLTHCPSVCVIGWISRQILGRKGLTVGVSAFSVAARARRDRTGSPRAARAAGPAAGTPAVRRTTARRLSDALPGRLRKQFKLVEDSHVVVQL